MLSKIEQSVKPLKPFFILNGSVHNTLAKMNAKGPSYIKRQILNGTLSCDDKGRLSIKRIQVASDTWKDRTDKSYIISKIEKTFDCVFDDDWQLERDKNWRCKGFLMNQPIQIEKDCSGKFVLESRWTKSTSKKIKTSQEYQKAKEALSMISEADKKKHDRGVGSFVQKYFNKEAVEQRDCWLLSLAFETGVVVDIHKELSAKGRWHFRGISNIPRITKTTETGDVIIGRDRLLPPSVMVQDDNDFFKELYHCDIDAVCAHISIICKSLLDNESLPRLEERQLRKFLSVKDKYTLILNYIGTKTSDVDWNSKRDEIKKKCVAVCNVNKVYELLSIDNFCKNFFSKELKAFYRYIQINAGDKNKLYYKTTQIEQKFMNELRAIQTAEGIDFNDMFDGNDIYGTSLSKRTIRALKALEKKYSIFIKITSLSNTSKEGSKKKEEGGRRGGVESRVYVSDIQDNKTLYLNNLSQNTKESKISAQERRDESTPNGNIQGPIPMNITEPNNPNFNITKPKKENQNMTKPYLEAVNPDEELDAFVKELRKDQAPVSKPLPQKAQLFLKKLEEEKQAKLLKLQQLQSTEQGVQHASIQNEKLPEAPEQIEATQLHPKLSEASDSLLLTAKPQRHNPFQALDELMMHLGIEQLNENENSFMLKEGRQGTI